MRNIPYVNLIDQHAAIKSETLAAIEGVLDHAHFILGREVEEFERRIAAYTGTRYAVGVNSGTDALFLSLKACGVGPGDEVITAPNSFLSSASVIVACGAKPVFADVNEDMNIDSERIEEKITGRTKAIIPVHLTGKPAAMREITAIARRHDLKVIEDAAQAIGAEYDGKRVGSLADAGWFSLHPLKTLNACGDGGIVTTDSEAICRTIWQLRNVGLKNRGESDIWGYNSRLDTIHAAVLLVKLRYLEKWTASRRRNAEIYRQELEGFVRVPREEDHERCVYHTFVIQTEKRDELMAYLQERGVGTRIHYLIPLHLQKAAEIFGYKPGDYPVCERQAGMILSLPVYQGLTPEDIRYVCDGIKEFCTEKGLVKGVGVA